MFAGIDFASGFEKDNFAIRRTYGNWYDPESLITGAESCKYKYMRAEPDGTPDSEPAAPAEIVFQPKAQSGIAVEETGRKFRITP